jgi:hypothetical protein
MRPARIRMVPWRRVRRHTPALRGRHGRHTPGVTEGLLADAHFFLTPNHCAKFRGSPTAQIALQGTPALGLRGDALPSPAAHVVPLCHHPLPGKRLSAFPQALLVLGDGVCSFNLTYGQGKSFAALHVRALRQLLIEQATGGQGLEGLALAFLPKVAEVISAPWTLAATQDLAYSQTMEERPPDVAEGREYFARFDALAVEDVSDDSRAEPEALAENLAQTLASIRGLLMPVGGDAAWR